jgi:2-isopropylmalate synthase
VDAVFKVIKKIVNIKSSLVVYQVNAITKGTDAQAEVSVRLEDNGVSVLGVGNDIDTIVASGKAYINALNKLILKKDKAADSKRTLKSQSKKIDKHVI